MPLNRSRKTLFSLAAVAMTLGLLEAGARLAEGLVPHEPRRYPTPAPGDDRDFMVKLHDRRIEVGSHIPMIADLQNKWGLAPGILQIGAERIRINSLGLRGQEIEARAPGELRILTLGDSSIFGVSTREEDVFSEVAAAELSRALGRPVRAVNGGIPGYDSGQSLQLLRRVGPKVRPTYVVIGNIWSDIYVKDPQRSCSINRGWLLSSLAQRSASYRALHRALGPLLRPVKVRFIASRNDIGSVSGTGPPARVSLSRYLRNLEAMAGLARELGARPVFLALPAPMDFDAHPPPDTVQDFREAMRQVAARQGVSLLDGVAVFRRSHPDAVWFLDQVHPSPEGHFLLGRALAHLLAQQVNPGEGAGGPGGPGR